LRLSSLPNHLDLPTGLRALPVAGSPLETAPSRIRVWRTPNDQVTIQASIEHGNRMVVLETRRPPSSELLERVAEQLLSHEDEDDVSISTQTLTPKSGTSMTARPVVTVLTRTGVHLSAESLSGLGHPEGEGPALALAQQRALARFVVSPFGRLLTSSLQGRADQFVRRSVRNFPADMPAPDLASQQCMAIDHAATYFVSKTVLGLLQEPERCLKDYAFSAVDLPNPSAYLWFEKPLDVGDVDGIPVPCAAWDLSSARSLGAVFLFGYMPHPDRPEGVPMFTEILQEGWTMTTLQDISARRVLFGQGDPTEDEAQKKAGLTFIANMLAIVRFLQDGHLVTRLTTVDAEDGPHQVGVIGPPDDRV